jgi:hypothetical protein
VTDKEKGYPQLTHQKIMETLQHKYCYLDFDQRSDHEGSHCQNGTQKLQWQAKNEEENNLLRSFNKSVGRTQVLEEIVTSYD